MNTEKYKKLLEAQKREHEKTWQKMRQAEKIAQGYLWDYSGAMEDNKSLVAAMRKHLKAMSDYLDLNYPIKGGKK